MLHYPGELVRLIAQMSMGSDALAIIGDVHPLWWTAGLFAPIAALVECGRQSRLIGRLGEHQSVQGGFRGRFEHHRAQAATRPSIPQGFRFEGRVTGTKKPPGWAAFVVVPTGIEPVTFRV